MSKEGNQLLPNNAGKKGREKGVIHSLSASRTNRSMRKRPERSINGF